MSDLADKKEKKECERERGRQKEQQERVEEKAVRNVSRSPNSRASLSEQTVEIEKIENFAFKPSYITAMCETVKSDGLHPYSIRGNCSGEFFRKTVNAFYARHPEVVRAEPDARRFVDGQWCTMFSAGEKWTKYDQPDWPVLIPESDRVDKNEKKNVVHLVIPRNDKQ